MSVTGRDAAGEHQREEQKMQEQEKKKQEQGFTLIELLIAIVVVGILTAVAIVGIAGLTNKGQASACSATIDAAQSASAVYYANNNSQYPSSFTDLQPPKSNPTLLDVHGVTVAPFTLTGNGWTIAGTFSTSAEPIFTGTVTSGGANCEGGSGGS
jgi:prepilin-type N-terminal cleavage/methylation domain-containing protein